LKLQIRKTKKAMFQLNVLFMKYLSKIFVDLIEYMNRLIKDTKSFEHHLIRIFDLIHNPYYQTNKNNTFLLD